MKTKRPTRETLLAAVIDQPWALHLPTLSTIVENLARHPDLEWAAAMARQQQAAPQPRPGGSIAVIPVHGMIEQRASIWDELFGATSIEATQAAFRAAMADPRVRAIVLDVDSPGGTVAGTPEFAEEIRAARGGQKRIVAVANTLAASAAYWLASQADEVVVSPSGSVGSIGIVAVHQEMSKHLEMEGIGTTIISAGAHKTDGNPFEPLTDEARAHLQERADAFYSQFVADVAKGRRVSASVVRSQYGEGRVVLAKQALAAGMVDHVETLDATIVRVAKAVGAQMPAVEAAAAGDVVLTASGPITVTNTATTGATIAAPEPPPTFTDRAAALAAEAAALVDHAETRARLRAKEGRPAFSTTTERSLRSIRDAISTLLDLADPDEGSAADDQPGEPAAAAAPVVPAPPPAAPVPVRRFRSDQDWAAYLQEITSR